MGLITRIIGNGSAVTALGSAATGVAEVFTQNATRRMELDEEAYARAIGQLGQEFQLVRPGWFDSFVNGLNRLPRPFLTLGTMGLFVYAMAEPAGFGLRMEGLQTVPEPLWWLLGAIVSFYFGAREAHYFRDRGWTLRKPKTTADDTSSVEPMVTQTVRRPTDSFADNAALRDWVSTLRD